MGKCSTDKTCQDFTQMLKSKKKKKKKKNKNKMQIQIKEIKNKAITPINTKTSGTRPKDQRKTVK